MSPFEMASACLEIATSRDITRQILRHRSFSFQEFSQRYADVSMLSGMVERECRMQDISNRQNSLPCEDETTRLSWQWMQERVWIIAEEHYKAALVAGIAKEQARAVLPEGLTVSRMYMNGTLRSWIHFIELRSANGTQKEHQEVALACAQAIAQIFPMAAELVAKDQ